MAFEPRLEFPIQLRSGRILTVMQNADGHLGRETTPASRIGSEKGTTEKRAGGYTKALRSLGWGLLLMKLPFLTNPLPEALARSRGAVGSGRVEAYGFPI